MLHTAQWMGAFYEAVHDGEPIDQAVRNAKLRFLRSSTRLNHPFYWAGFVAAGHAGVTVDVGAPRTPLLVALALVIVTIPLLVLIHLKARAARRARPAAETE